MAEQPSAPIFVCANPELSELTQVVQAADWGVADWQPGLDLVDAFPGDFDPTRVALVQVAEADNLAERRRHFPHALVIGHADADFGPEVLDRHESLIHLVQHAESFWRKNLKVNELVRDVGRRRQRMHQLNEISMALTTRMTQSELFQTILTEACRIARCEAGSLFLVESQSGKEDALVVKHALNDVVSFPFVESRLPLSAESIVGYVAVTGHELNIRDVYQLSDDLPYRFNKSFDDENGYRAKSMLTIPMRDHRDRVVGVLQFINKINREQGGEPIPFGEETVEILRAIASQAAVSLQKNALLEDINQLFENFVQASVKAIEQRDPSTSGHSFRVAETTVALLEALPNSGYSKYRGLNLSQEHIREVRYAALLHDFGKIGVPEAILVKANKLSDDRLSIIQYRIELQKERLRRRAVEQEIELLHHSPMDIEVARRRVHRQLEKQLGVLDQYFDCIRHANNPNVLDEGDFGHLEEIRHYAFQELDGSLGNVITDEDLLALSVRRGSLTPEERRAIQSHVVYTKEFLSVLPWPPELAQVPDIAGAHHERIDGSGYPAGLVGEQIPLASRVMAVCDIYDALTSMDRPYKASMSVDTAFKILRDEANQGLLEQDMVDIFIASGSYQISQAS